jgi:hypothetical protein
MLLHNLPAHNRAQELASRAPPYPKSPNFHCETKAASAAAGVKPAVKDTKPKAFSP